jgi:hypothetical protein
MKKSSMRSTDGAACVELEVKRVRFSKEVQEHWPPRYVCVCQVAEVAQSVCGALEALHKTASTKAGKGCSGVPSVVAEAFKIVEDRTGLSPWCTGEATAGVMREQLVKLQRWIVETAGHPVRTGMWYVFCFQERVRKALLT